MIPFQLSAQSSAADSSSVEWIKAYFNQPADYSVARLGNMSKSNADLIGTLKSLIESAEHSIDLAIYDLEHPRIGRALVTAAERGLRVRVVTDNYNRTDADEIDSAMWTMLRQADIISIDDDGDVYEADGTIDDNNLTNAGADMHHKFAVIDALSDSPHDDKVWTGSTNLTYTGAYNTNNTIVIKDSDIAAAYLNEFEQMWGDNDETPEPEAAKYHKDKSYVGEHTYFVDDTKVELYFSPQNRSGSKPGIMNRLVEVIKQETQNDLAFQAFAITPSIPLSQTIWKMSATGEIDLNGVIDPLFYYQYKSRGDIWTSREANLTNRMILPANEMRKLHHKVMLIDAKHPDVQDQAITIAGSYNFSKNAEVNNDENLLIIYSDRITNQYYQDFSGVVRRAKREVNVPAPHIDSEKWYPVAEVSDGSRFAITVLPGFEYDVEFLGVDVPRVYAGQDSLDYYANEAEEYLRNLISGGTVRLKSASGDIPASGYGAFQGYVTLKTEQGKIISLNKQLLKQGFGEHEQYYAQHPDSVRAFKRYTREARDNSRGMWKNPEKVGKKLARSELADGEEPSDAFPININTADASLIQLLPGIGPAYSERIIDYRDRNGSFSGVDQLENIKGIGPTTMGKLRPNVVVE
ncbi:phospholipase D-like domain-containing protein [Fodinibius sp. Rm-B-1B1-1]|uniref:phospholipase D-like domain-containing protein n=1 Tax=Fodinibius alkaliphilus TaxID=3140241 RepID=UPI00315B0167